MNRKLSLRLILLTIVPASMLELMNNIYNLYVPIYFQAGGPGFNKAVVTFGFGVGAFFVGVWLVVDNVLSFLFSPFVGARSDRTRSRLGRRRPFILMTLPLLAIGYALIPIGPKHIPAELNGQQAQLRGLFVFFLASCAIYFLGFVPVRSILQTLRQESVVLKERAKVESWYICIVNAFTILAYLYGRRLYEVSGPLIFWSVLGLYIISAVVTVTFYREPDAPAVSPASPHGKSDLRQVFSVFRDASAGVSRNSYFYLASVMVYGISLSSLLTFSPSWVVVTLGTNESRAAAIMAVFWVAATLVPLPAAYLGVGRARSRNLYLVGILTTTGSALLLFIAPGLYPLGLFGLGAGLSITLTFQLPMASEVVYDQNALGTMIGLYNFVYMFGVLLGANITGLLIQLMSYRVLYLTVAAMSLTAAVLAMFIRPQPPSLPEPGGDHE